MYVATKHAGIRVRNVFYLGKRFQDHRVTRTFMILDAKCILGHDALTCADAVRSREATEVVHFQSVFASAGQRYPRTFSTGRH